MMDVGCASGRGSLEVSGESKTNTVLNSSLELNHLAGKKY